MTGRNLEPAGRDAQPGWDEADDKAIDDADGAAIVTARPGVALLALRAIARAVAAAFIGMFGFVLTGSFGGSAHPDSASIAVLVVAIVCVWVGFGMVPLGGWIGRRFRRRYGSEAVDHLLNQEVNTQWSPTMSGRSALGLIAALGCGLVGGLAFSIVVSVVAR